MASHPLVYDPYPQVNPSGGPDARQYIHADPDMFGAAIGKGLNQIGQGVEKADDAGFDVATMVAKQDDQTHANELHSWQSDQVSNAQEKFLTLKGKDAEMALPAFKKQIDDIHQQARSQAGNPYTAQQVDTEGRRLTDAAYAQSARHAAQQKSVWDTNTATDGAASSGSRAALGAATTPGDVHINANPSVVLSLDRSDDFARQAAQLKGLDGDIEVQRNRGKNVTEIIKSTVADGSQAGLQKAIDFFHAQYEKMDPGSRATIEQALKQQAATYDGQKAVDTFMGRVSGPNGFTAPPGYINRGNQVESGGNPNATTGSYRGLGQWSPALEKRYGINDSNRNDPTVQARAWTLEAYENHDPLTRALGHEPTAADYYLAHQQGVGGATAHLSQPNLAAWQNMASTIEGQEKGQGWAKQAIWGNMTPEMKAQFPGGVDTVTSGDFARMWSQRFNQQPIQASGLLPGNGTQLPGGATPAAFTGVDRLQGAQAFAEQSKSDVIKQIMDNPYLRDRPQAMNAALTYANKVYESQTANYADMERQLHVQEQQKKLVSEDAENDYLKQIYAPALNAKPLNVQSIVLDDRLSREAKDRVIKLVKDPGEKRRQDLLVRASSNLSRWCTRAGRHAGAHHGPEGIVRPAREGRRPDLRRSGKTPRRDQPETDAGRIGRSRDEKGLPAQRARTDHRFGRRPASKRPEGRRALSQVQCPGSPCLRRGTQGRQVALATIRSRQPRLRRQDHQELQAPYGPVVQRHDSRHHASGRFETRIRYRDREKPSRSGRGLSRRQCHERAGRPDGDDERLGLAQGQSGGTG